MARAVITILILTVYIQANMGIFEKFNTPEKKDKNKMLMYLRGLLRLDTTERTKVHIDKRGVPSPNTEAVGTEAPSPPEQVLDSKQNLPEISDKSKMLAYLRGVKSPYSALSVYEEPKHRLDQSIQDIETNHITQNANARMSQNDQDKQNLVIDPPQSDVVNTQYSYEAAPNWKDATATQVTFLQPAERERESDTCFWRGQHQPQPKPIARATDDGKDEPSVLENVGDAVINFFKCIKTKFYKAYDKLREKICGFLDNVEEKGVHNKTKAKG